MCERERASKGFIICIQNIFIIFLFIYSKLNSQVLRKVIINVVGIIELWVQFKERTGDLETTEPCINGTISKKKKIIKKFSIFFSLFFIKKKEKNHCQQISKEVHIPQQIYSVKFGMAHSVGDSCKLILKQNELSLSLLSISLSLS